MSLRKKRNATLVLPPPMNYSLLPLRRYLLSYELIYLHIFVQLCLKEIIFSQHTSRLDLD